MLGRWIVGGFAIALLITPLEAQLPRPLIPLPESGLRVTPTFDGWYKNPDGTVSYSFGYSNLNKDTVEIPLGPDNFITPKEYDGRQPTSFPAVAPDAQDGGGPAPTPAPGAAGTPAAAAPPAAGGGGGAQNRRDRARGVFTVTVPGTFKGDVVWTLRFAGQTWATPARSKSVNYQLSWPMAMGSVPPLVRLTETGKDGRGPNGIQGPALQAKVGAPLALTAWIKDDAVHEKEPIVIKTRTVTPGMNVTWYKHQGPGPIAFDPEKSPFPDPSGKSSTNATFKEPGEYTIRVRADTFGHVDSSSGNQCCWTNGYWKVTVTR